MTLEYQIAHTLLEQFNCFYRCFLDVTRGAAQRFANADWACVQQASAERIRLYDHHAIRAVRTLQVMTRHVDINEAFLSGIKNSYSALIRDHQNFEIAESFYNSVYRKIFHHENIADSHLFVHSSQNANNWSFTELCVHYDGPDLKTLLTQAISDAALPNPFEDKSRDLNSLIERIVSIFPQTMSANRHQLVLLKPIFYRNKGAYLVGRYHNEQFMFPFALPVLQNEQRKLYIDTLLYSSDEISIIFGFARSYFFVDAPAPRRIVNFLKELLPNKTDYELFTAIGCQKHGKTALYRHYLNHLNHSDDQFELAPGIKGMVMSVFTLPSYDIVFKVIKDKFTPPKEISHATVKAKYLLVKTHDRVGRMADTQEFTNFTFPRDRFSHELLEELKSVAPSQLDINDHTITISHLYTERKMVPLNIYLSHADESQTYKAIDEYGNALKQLAAANIFPGDMLFKNFGVTRHGRVIFYDYDEISYMTECNFRQIPAPRYPEDEWAAEPWYSVAPNDIFPEEFATFLFSNPKVREIFTKLHGELLTATYWQALQEHIRAGHQGDVFPYRRRIRFKSHEPNTDDTAPSNA
jgi:isocitrate dehydrogenase kinase/phosphatase